MNSPDYTRDVNRILACYSPAMLRFLLMCLLFLASPVHAENDLEAVRKAAEQGHADAQFLLGLMYDVGEGVPENDAEAVRWYRKAAEQGDAPAQNNLGLMYGNGEGIPEDRVQAYVWFSIAAAQGDCICKAKQRTCR